MDNKMTENELEDVLLENGLDGTSFFKGDYISAILGYTEDGRLVYSYNKMVDWLVDSVSMSDAEASEYIDFNVIRTVPYMGEKSPIILYDLVY